MKITRIITDIYGYQENCYLLEKDNKILIIDPGNDYLNIKEKLKDKQVLGFLITHNHMDHIGVLSELLNDYNVNIYDYSLEEKDYSIDKFKFKIIKTPGHTNDSVSFYFEDEKVMFTGDFIFKGTIGRTDLPTGDMNTMINSIKKIKTYPKDIIIYPGHGESTTIENELKSNYYLM